MTEWLRRLNRLEPARVRAAWASIMAICLALGITISADTDRAVQAGIVLLFALLPLAQGELTRAKVTPVAKLDEDTIDVPDDSYEDTLDARQEIGE